MAAIAENIFGRSNRRRCVKGRISYTDTSDIIIENDEDKLEKEIKGTENHLEYGVNENLDDVDEVDEEPVTIDLSEFLNENPILTEPSENVTDSAGVLTDCHSQFRVTSSLADPSPLAVEAISSLKDLNINENITPTEDFCSSESISEIPPTVLKEDNTTVLSTDLAKVENDKSPRKENLLNGFKPSPNKNFKSKPTITSNLLEKYKNFSRLKDFNKNNLKVFGKYPIIKCEKLDIENFIKKSNIKVGNWPMQCINSQPKNKSVSSKTSLNKVTKTPVRKLPKLLNKPISFNRGVSNSRNVSTVKKAQSILIDALKSNASPLIIKTDNWKPEIANLSDHSAHFDSSAENFRIPVPQSFNKSIGNHRIIKLVHQKSPLLQMNDSGTQNQKLPIITSVNKVANGPKTFQLISPNTLVGAKTEKNKTVTPILPKPSSGSIISPVLLKDYTVIQPYVEDPTSPIRPKPLLTVPLDIVPVVDTFNQQGTVTAVPEVHRKIKPPTKSKPFQSVFLNGAIKQTSSPVKISKELPSVNLPVVSHCNTEIPANFVEDKIEEQLKDDTSTITPKFAVVDAMESAFVKPEIKKSPKLKQNLNKQNQLNISLTTHSECQAYNSTLNDMLFGFSDTGDFTDENYAVNTNIDTSLEVCNLNTVEQSSGAYQSAQKDTLEIQLKNSEKDHKSIKLFSRHKLRRKSIASPHDSDTLSASEGEDDKSGSPMKSSCVSTRKHKISQTPEKSLNLGIVSEESDIDLSPKKLILDAEATVKVISQNKRNTIRRRNSTNNPTKNYPKLADQSKDKKSESNTLNSSKSFIERSSINLKSKDDNSQNNTKQNIGKNSNSVNKTERLRGKLKAVKESKGNINSYDKRKSALKCQRHIVPIIKGKRMVYVRPKFKMNAKKSRTANIVNKKPSTPDDIINEINTITGSILISNKGSRKREKAIPLKETNVNNPDLPVTKTKNDSKATTANQNKKNLPVRSKTKKNKTLKVLFKRTTPRQKSKSLEMPFEEICHTMLNDKKNALLGNNTNPDSSLRDTKNHKMGTSSKDENKSNVEIFCNNLKSDDSLKENICSKDKILSKEVPSSNVTNDSKNTDNEDSIHHENCSNSDLQEIKLSTKKQENASEIGDLVTLTPEENSINCLTENIDDTPEDLVCLDSKDESEIKNIDVPIKEQSTVNKDLENINGIAPCNEIHSEDRISNDRVTQSDIQDNLIVLSSEEINETNTTFDEIQSNVHRSNMVIKSDVEDRVDSVQYENANEVSITSDEDKKQENSHDKASNLQYENANEVLITFDEDQKQENSPDKVFNVQYENANEVSLTFDEDQKQENSPDNVFNVQYENADEVSATFDENQKQENSPDKAPNVQCENGNEVSITFDEDQKQENSPDKVFNAQYENANEVSATFDEDRKEESSSDKALNVQYENANDVSITFDDQEQANSLDKAFNVQYENANEVSTTFDEDQKQANCPDKSFKANVDDNILNILPKDTIEMNDAFAVQKSYLSSELLLQTNAEDSTENSDSMNTSEIVTTCEETPRHDLDSNSVGADINGNENEIVNINEPNETKVLTPLPEKDVSPEEISKKKDPKMKRKSCPKIKISVAKPSDKSDLISNSKNWYISERKDSTDSSNSEEIAKQNECGNSEDIGNAMSTSVPVKISKENDTLIDEMGNESENVADQMSVNDVIPLELINVATSPNKSNCALSPCVTDGTSVIDKDTDIPAVVMSSANVSDNTDSELPVPTSENSVSEKSFVSSSKRLISEEKADSVASFTSIKIKEEPIDFDESSILNCTDPSIANIKLEKEESAESLNEISSHASPVSPSERNKLHNTVGHKQLKTDPDSTADSGAIHETTKETVKTYLSLIQQDVIDAAFSSLLKVEKGHF
ncbi:MBD domain-containing protein [Trichonephila clavipes]|uniref:MBD domain-containing protein n=1 Tax=Trichonephila clavipes TaxID=2585209 RepID=A0A8X6RFT0_TRICX|nr:MBD domain-containing protein [Trichonephila clavipes]